MSVFLGYQQRSRPKNAGPRFPKFLGPPYLGLRPNGLTQSDEIWFDDTCAAVAIFCGVSRAPNPNGAGSQRPPNFCEENFAGLSTNADARSVCGS